MSDLPIKGWPYLALPYLSDLIPNIIRDRNISQFYIGRSNNIVQTKSRHRAENIFALYETASIPNALQIEQGLLDEFGNHYKCNNVRLHSGGCISEGYYNYVYIALWYKN